MRVGYARVSTQDLQHDAFLAAGCETGPYLHRTVSGKLARRPELDKALLVLRNGDQLAVTKLDRLGRSLSHLITLSAELRQQSYADDRRGHRARSARPNFSAKGIGLNPSPGNGWRTDAERTTATKDQGAEVAAVSHGFLTD